MSGTGEVLSVLLLASSLGLMMLGFGVAFSLAAIGLLFAGLGSTLGVFDLRLLGILPSRYFSIMQNEVLVAVPLFIFMGVLLERSRIAEQLLITMGCGDECPVVPGLERDDWPLQHCTDKARKTVNLKTIFGLSISL